MNNLDHGWNQLNEDELLLRFHKFFEIEPQYQHLLTDEDIISTFADIYQEIDESEYKLEWFVDMGKRIKNTPIGAEREDLIREFYTARENYLLNLPILDNIEKLFKPFITKLFKGTPSKFLEDAMSYKGDTKKKLVVEEYSLLYFLAPSLAGLMDVAGAEYELSTEDEERDWSIQQIIEYIKYMSNTQAVVRHNPQYLFLDRLEVDEATKIELETFANEYHRAIAIMCPDFTQIEP